MTPQLSAESAPQSAMAFRQNNTGWLRASIRAGFHCADLRLPGVPDWADCFSDELKTHPAVTDVLGIGCDPVIVKGTKDDILDWLG